MKLQIPISRFAGGANDSWNTSSTLKQYAMWQNWFTSLDECFYRTNKIM